MKRMRAVESDSVKSGKLKITFTRPVKERQKLVSELCIGRNKTMCKGSCVDVGCMMSNVLHCVNIRPSA